jgi:tetratricopeptide (TPR) repeat protein
MAVALLAACGSDGPELQGDRAYGAGRFTEALTHYQDAARRRSDARIWAKLGAAATRAGDLQTAADAYRRLAEEDPSRTDEAADGLDLVARAADRRGDMAALHDAVLALRTVAPNRPVARFALTLVRRSAVTGADAAALLPVAMAGAPDGETMDSLLMAYGAALQKASGCDQAAPVYRSVLRRTRSATVRSRIGPGVASCALDQGLAALSGGRPADAARWFSQAVAVDSSSSVGRRALIGLGDARVGQGDIVGAAIAFQSAVVVRAGVADSLTRLAEDRLRSLGAPPRDSARRGFP